MKYSVHPTTFTFLVFLLNMFLPDLPCNVNLFSAGTIISLIQTEICQTIFDLFSENKKNDRLTEKYISLV